MCIKNIVFISHQKMKNKNRWIVELLNQTINDIGKWKITDKNQIKESLEWFKHERFIHLLVTTFVWLFFAILLTADNDSILLDILTIIMLILEWCYLYHYYRLENWVQKLNQLYIKLLPEKIK